MCPLGRTSGKRKSSIPVRVDGVRQSFEDDNRLYGGDRDSGGLANVGYYWHDNRNDNIAGRPLGVSRRQRPIGRCLIENESIRRAFCRSPKILVPGRRIALCSENAFHEPDE